VGFLRDGLRTPTVLGLVVALGAYLVGLVPGHGRRPRRGRLRNQRPAAVAGRRSTGRRPRGAFVHAHVRLLQGAALGLAVLTFVLLDQPTGLDILLLAFGLVIVLAIIKFLDQESAADASAE
jgi:hypothetical protein